MISPVWVMTVIHVRCLRRLCVQSSRFCPASSRLCSVLPNHIILIAPPPSSKSWPWTWNPARPTLFLFNLERTDSYRATVHSSLSIRPKPGYLTCWPLRRILHSKRTFVFSPIVGFSVSPSNKWISHQSWVILFLRVTIFWPREKKRNWFHSWPMRRAETCFWKRENKNVSRQRKTWIHDFRLLNILNK